MHLDTGIVLQRLPAGGRVLGGGTDGSALYIDQLLVFRSLYRSLYLTHRGHEFTQSVKNVRKDK